MPCLCHPQSHAFRQNAKSPLLSPLKCGVNLMRFLGARREVTLIDQAQQTTEISMHAMVQLSLALANTSKLVLKVQPILWSNNFLCSTENKRLCQQHFLAHGPNQLRRKLSIKPLVLTQCRYSAKSKTSKLNTVMSSQSLWRPLAGQRKDLSKLLLFNLK